ncbi:sulfate ABC transporter permease subunit CysT [Carnimonas nigrificans]|uniref:sulfate ABC transporter permease subunit CysT n=1 Tax=Carnimonas nigrificans TaxID=64323 RepID=UPI000470EC90|nr:sulfate ABC transporter permease subunit CysT [Carnimonas nigrificans]
MSKPRRILPGFHLSLGIALVYVSIILLLPLGSLVGQLADLSWARYWSIITDPRNLASYRITVLSAALASLFNMLFGLLCAWVLVRYTFPGKRILDALMDLPFALPTAVAGITISTLYASQGAIGQWLGFKVAYSWLGIVVAMAFTSVPFVVRTVQPVLEELPASVDEAAITLGASNAYAFRRVILPFIWPALLTGTGLAFARSLGEYGAVIFVAGNMPYKTEVTSLMVVTRLQEFDYPAAAAIASVVLIASLLLLLVINIYQARFFRRIHGNQHV